MQHEFEFDRLCNNNSDTTCSIQTNKCRPKSFYFSTTRGQTKLSSGVTGGGGGGGGAPDKG